MVIDLSVQRPLCKGFFQFIKQAVFRKRRFRIRSSQKMIKQLVGNVRLLSSRPSAPPSLASQWPSHEIADSLDCRGHRVEASFLFNESRAFIHFGPFAIVPASAAIRADLASDGL